MMLRYGEMIVRTHIYIYIYMIYANIAYIYILYAYIIRCYTDVFIN